MKKFLLIWVIPSALSTLLIFVIVNGLMKPWGVLLSVAMLGYLWAISPYLEEEIIRMNAEIIRLERCLTCNGGSALVAECDDCRGTGKIQTRV